MRQFGPSESFEQSLGRIQALLGVVEGDDTDTTGTPSIPTVTVGGSQADMASQYPATDQPGGKQDRSRRMVKARTKAGPRGPYGDLHGRVARPHLSRRLHPCISRLQGLATTRLVRLSIGALPRPSTSPEHSVPYLLPNGALLLGPGVGEAG